FVATDQLSFNGVPIDSTFVDSTTRTFTIPALPAGDYTVVLTDEIGTDRRGPDFTVTPAPTISTVVIVSGPHSGTKGIPAEGGSTRIGVTGTSFHDTDVVTLGGAAVEFKQDSVTSLSFIAPAGSL